jgi:hypothetical protein
LDKHHSYDMYGQPVAHHQVPADSNVVRPIWNYSQKAQGEHKAQKFMDGKGNTYAVCMEQHILRLFVAITAYLGNLIGDSDVLNAYAHAPSQGITIYIAVDNVFQAWYLAHLKIEPPLGTCVPFLKAMQGHPSAGTWPSEHFDATCAAPLQLVPAFTEPTLYRRDDTAVKVLHSCSGRWMIS